MNKLPDEQLRSLLEAGYELRDIEFKPPFSWNTDHSTLWIREVVCKGILAMSNTRSGGRIIIGVNEDKVNNKVVLTGLSDDELSTFDNFDGIKGFVDGYSYVDTNFQMSWGELKETNNAKFVVISVQEFYDIPLICKKDSQSSGLMRKDDLYSRSKKAPYSSIRVTDIELRELIGMAVDKEKTNLESRGLVYKNVPSAEQHYNKQVEDLI